MAQVAGLQHRDSRGYRKKNVTKRLAAIRQLAFEVIPQDPTRPEYRQGNTLGEDNKHWFCAKFFQQYRLFFRFHAPSKTIVYAWDNDQDTKRRGGVRSGSGLPFLRLRQSNYCLEEKQET